jgi:hypothetical protein
MAVDVGEVFCGVKAGAPRGKGRGKGRVIHMRGKARIGKNKVQIPLEALENIAEFPGLMGEVRLIGNLVFERKFHDLIFP